jgi:guanylate kinase
MSRKIVCLVGPSGSGKTELEDRITNLGYNVLKSYTTRGRRFPDEDSRTFVTEEEFEEIRLDLVAYTEFAGHEYGATMEQVEANDLYVVDPDGVMDLRATVGRGNLYVIFLKVPSRICFSRMARTRSMEHARERVKHDGAIFPNFTDYDMLIPNNDLDDLELNVKIIEGVINRWCKK